MLCVFILFVFVTKQLTLPMISDSVPEDSNMTHHLSKLEAFSEPLEPLEPSMFGKTKTDLEELAKEGGVQEVPM